MKKVGLITINDNNNYGNRLQNYAIQTKLKQLKFNCTTIKNDVYLNNKGNVHKKFCIFQLKKIKRALKQNKRKKLFLKFNKNINFSKMYFYWNGEKRLSRYDYLLVGSDQVWNPTFYRLSDFDLAEFRSDIKKISFSASFGISELPEQYYQKVSKALNDFKAISVREDAGKKIVEDLTGRKDVQVLVDPTMLLTSEEWDKVSRKPVQLKTDKYILNYFLGELSEKRKKEIEKVAKENNCEIINILDKNNPFYQTGPSEFLYLEKNAFLICTDSFHSSVFAILYNRPFLVFDREDNLAKMNSRIETLLKKFNLQDRKYKGTITKENLEHDYKEAYKILEEEKDKTMKFLKKALDI